MTNHYLFACGQGKVCLLPQASLQGSLEDVFWHFDEAKLRKMVIGELRVK